jgi:hypothetical protein
VLRADVAVSTVKRPLQLREVVLSHVRAVGRLLTGVLAYVVVNDLVTGELATNGFENPQPSL